jgi:hypothetical protein
MLPSDKEQLVSFNAGSVVATLDVDRTPFQQGLDQAKADAQDFADQVYKATLGVDTEQGDTDRDEFKSKLDEIGQLEETAQLRVNDGDSQATVDKLSTSLDALGAKTVTAHGSVDLGDSAEKVTLLKTDLDELDLKSVNIPVNVDTGDDIAKLAAVKLAADDASGSSGGGGLSGLLKAGEDASTGLDAVAQGAEDASGGGASGGGLSGLGSVLSNLPLDLLNPVTFALAGLSTALIPIGGLAIGAGIGLAGMATAAGAGIGAFALAALPVYTQVSTALTQISADQDAVNRATSQAQENTAVTHLNDDLKNLSPTIATVVEGVLNVKQAFTDWDAQFQPEILNVFAAALADVKPLLNDITPLVHAGASAMQSFFDSIGQVANSPAFGQFIQFLANEAPAAISTITTAVEDFGAGFANVLERGSPLIKDVENGIVDLAKGFENFSTSKTFEDFLGWVQQNGPAIVADVEKIAIAAGHLITTLAPFGLLILNYGADVIQFVGKFGSLVTQLANFFTETIPHAVGVMVDYFTHGFDSAYNSVMSFWHGMENDFVHPLTDFFENTIPHTVDDFVGFFTAIPGRVNHVWSDVINALHEAWSTVANWVNDNVITPVVHFFEGIPGFIAHVWSDVVTALETAWNVISGWVNDNIIQPVVQFFESIPGAIAHVWSDVVSAFEGAWDAISGWVSSNVIQPVVSFFESIPGGIAHVWSDVVGDIENGWNVISGWVKTNVIDPVVNFFKGMPNDITDALSTLADVIEAPFKAAWSVIQPLISGIDALLGAVGIHIGQTVSAAQGAANTINAILPTSNPSLSGAPHNAAGTGMGTFQGLTMVGELGPELVNFGSPVQIIPNSAITNLPNSIVTGLSGQSSINSLADADVARFSGQVGSGQVVYSPTYNLEVSGAIDAQTLAQLKSMLNEHDAEVIDTLATELASTRIW